MASHGNRGLLSPPVERVNRCRSNDWTLSLLSLSYHLIEARDRRHETRTPFRLPGRTRPMSCHLRGTRLPPARTLPLWVHGDWTSPGDLATSVSSGLRAGLVRNAARVLTAGAVTPVPNQSLDLARVSSVFKSRIRRDILCRIRKASEGSSCT